MNNKIIGYTTGAFDLFHIGHLNILKNAKSMCDKLIVGVSTDELIINNKNKKPIIPFDERIEIIRSLKYVDTAIPQETYDKVEHWKKLKFDLMFVGDDWYQNERWADYEKKLKKVGVSIIYFPYTKTTSSSILRKKINNI